MEIEGKYKAMQWMDITEFGVYYLQMKRDKGSWI